MDVVEEKKKRGKAKPYHDITYRQLDRALAASKSEKAAGKLLGISRQQVSRMQAARSGVTFAIISDTHTGHRVGLTPNMEIPHDQGGAYLPKGKFHDFQTAHWEAYKSQMETYYEQGRKIVGVFGGDAIEAGTPHHRNRAGDGLWSITPAEEVYASQALLTPFRNLCHKMYFVRGTESHVAACEQVIAASLDCERNPMTNTDSYTFDWLEVEAYGKLINIAHHGVNLGGKQHTRHNALHNQLKDLHLQSETNGTRLADVYIWGHYHRFAHASYTPPIGRAREFRNIQGIILPAWKGLDTYTKRIKQKDVPCAAIGGVFVHVEESGAMTIEPMLKWYTLSEVMSV